VRRAAEYTSDGVDSATRTAKDGFEELSSHHPATRPEAMQDGRPPKPPCGERSPASTSVSRVGRAAARLRKFSWGATKRTSSRDGFEEFYGYEGRLEPRTERELAEAASSGRGTQLKLPLAGEKLLASDGYSVSGGISPAAVDQLRRLSTPTSTKTRDGFEEFFGYEDERPTLLRDRFGRNAAARQAGTDKGAKKEATPLEGSCPQVMDATEASLSMIRTAIEDKKELLKAKTSPELFDQICQEIRLLKSQQARLAGALWENQLQNNGEGVGTEMQLKAWLGNV